MKIRNVEVTRSHAMLLIISGMILSGLLTVVRHPLIDPAKAGNFFSFFSGTFAVVLVEWLREKPVIRLG